MPVVAGYQRRVSLRGETIGKVERASKRWIHVISPDLSSMESPRATHTSTTSAFSDSRFRRLWLRPAIMGHDPGLAASPLVGYRLIVEGGGWGASGDGYLAGPSWRAGRPLALYWRA